MCPQNEFLLLRPVKTITAICFTFQAEIISVLFLTLIGHSRRPDFGHILFICAQKVQLFLFFEINVPPKSFPSAKPCEEEDGNMLCMAIWNNFSYFFCIVSSFRAAGFRTNLNLFGPKSAIIFLFWPQFAPQMFSRCFALWRRTRQYALHGYLKKISFILWPWMVCSVTWLVT